MSTSDNTSSRSFSRPPMSSKVTAQRRYSVHTSNSTSDRSGLPPSSPRIKTTSNRPRPPSWLMDDDVDENNNNNNNNNNRNGNRNGNVSNSTAVSFGLKEGAMGRGGDTGLKSSQRAKVLVETARTTLRQLGAMKSLTQYLDQHLNEIFTDGNKAPEDDDVRYIVVAAWAEELLRYLAVKTIAKDIELPCKLGVPPPIDIAMRGLLTQVPSGAYRKLCRKLLDGVHSGIIEHDFENDDDNYLGGSRKNKNKNKTNADKDAIEEERQKAYVKKKHRYNKTVKAYQQCFEQVQPELYWPEPKRPREEQSLMTMLAETLSVNDQVKQMFQNGCRAEMPVLEEHTKQLFQNGRRTEGGKGAGRE